MTISVCRSKFRFSRVSTAATRPLAQLDAEPTPRSKWPAKDLAQYIRVNNSLPLPYIKPKESKIHRLWEGLMVPGSVVATGAIIELQPKKARKELLFKYKILD